MFQTHQSFGAVARLNAGGGDGDTISSLFGSDVVAHYTMDDSGSTITDSVGSNDLSVTGATASATGVQGTSYDFDGVNDYADGNTANTSGDVSVSVWFYKHDSTGNQMIFRIDNSANNLNFSTFWVGTEMRVQMKLDDSNTRRKSTTFDGDEGNLNEWNHMVFVWDDTAEEISGIYLNGADITSSFGDNDGGTLNWNPTASTLTLGAQVGGGSLRFDGLIDEFSIVDRKITLTEAGQIYNSGDGIPYD